MSDNACDHSYCFEDCCQGLCRNCNELSPDVNDDNDDNDNDNDNN